MNRISAQDAERMVKEKSDDELLAMLARSDDWQPQMLDATKAELQRRGVEFSLPVPQAIPQADSRYRGYGGWLRFFCVVQIYVAPVIAVILGAVSLSQIVELSGRFPGLLAAGVVELMGNLVVAGFGVYAGIKLRRLRPGAVGSAEHFLLTILAWGVLKIGLPFIGGELPSQVRVAMLVAMLEGFVGAGIFSGIWLSYFHSSKRIKATFPEG